MPYRDEHGHFISEEEARRRGLTDEPEETPEETPAEEPQTEAPPPSWVGQATHSTETVFIETGRGQTAEVQVGAPFQETIERIAEEAHYGGYFRVFLNGEEVINPEESPTTIEAGMRIALTSYDKVG